MDGTTTRTNDADARSRERTIAGFELERFLPYRLSVLANTVSQGLARTYHHDFGLSVPEWRVLAVLGRFPGLTASEVCERVVMDKVTVSRAVKALLAKKYFVPESDRSDRRRRPLRISEARGKAVLGSIIPLARAYEREMRRVLSPDEATVLDAAIERLIGQARSLDSGNHSIQA